MLQYFHADPTNPLPESEFLRNFRVDRSGRSIAVVTPLLNAKRTDFDDENRFGFTAKRIRPYVRW